MSAYQRFRWMLAVGLGGAVGAHLTAVGLSLGTVAAAVLFLSLIFTDQIKSFWRSPAVPVLGFAFGFCFILPIEIVLGVSALKFGPIYPPGRELTAPEMWVTTPLEWIFKWRLRLISEYLISGRRAMDCLRTAYCQEAGASLHKAGIFLPGGKAIAANAARRERLAARRTRRRRTKGFPPGVQFRLRIIKLPSTKTARRRGHRIVYGMAASNL